MDFQYATGRSNLCAAEFDIERVSGAPMVGGGVLQVHLKVRAKGLGPPAREMPYRLIWHAARLDGPAGTLPMMKPCGEALYLVDNNLPQLVTLRFELTVEQTLELDASRAEGDLPLQLWVWALIEGPAGLQLPGADGRITVEQSAWMRVMAEMRLVERALFECTFGVPDGNPTHALAAGHMKKSLKLLRAHQLKGAVAEAREAFEALEEKGLRGMDAAQTTSDRLRAMVGAIRHATHAGHHELKIGRVSPEQARAIVHAAAIAVEYLTTIDRGHARS